MGRVTPAQSVAQCTVGGVGTSVMGRGCASAAGRLARRTNQCADPVRPVPTRRGKFVSVFSQDQGGQGRQVVARFCRLFGLVRRVKVCCFASHRASLSGLAPFGFVAGRRTERRSVGGGQEGHGTADAMTRVRSAPCSAQSVAQWAGAAGAVAGIAYGLKGMSQVSHRASLSGRGTAPMVATARIAGAIIGRQRLCMPQSVAQWEVHLTHGGLSRVTQVLLAADSAPKSNAHVAQARCSALLSTAMASDPWATILLSDSTGYGWLPSARTDGADLVCRGTCFASIVCGGSLVKNGRKPVNIVDQLMREWMLKGGVEIANSDVEVALAVVPAEDSVPERKYQALQAARAGFGIREAGPSTMATAAEAYGEGKKPIHFTRDKAAAAMEAVVAAAVIAAGAGLAERRSARTALASAAERRSAADRWIAVVVCAGWNCNEHENLAEAFLLREMQAAVEWGELVQVLSAHSQHRMPWVQIAPRLLPVPALLLQTNREDHEGSRENMRTFAGQLERRFIADEECQQDLQQLGGAPLLARSASFQRGSHRADLWRYTRLHRTGGHYLDIKMALLQPLEDTFKAVYEDADQSLMGQSVARSHGAKSVRDIPHILLSIGANREHVYQGNILQCPPRHPLVTRALCDAMQTSPAQLVRTYLRFCEYLWAELTADLGHVPGARLKLDAHIRPGVFVPGDFAPEGRAEEDRDHQRGCFAN
eukprot:s556_g23.t1